MHWRDLDGAQQRRAVTTIAGLPIEGLVVVGSPRLPSAQERARRLCMEDLLPRLEAAWSVRHVVLEARTQSLNERDEKHIRMLRGKQWISSRTRVDLGLPSDEPALWAADVVAGAANSAIGGEPVHLDRLQHLVTQVHFDIARRH